MKYLEKDSEKKFNRGIEAPVGVSVGVGVPVGDGV